MRPSIIDLKQMKGERKITMLTAYDATMAGLLSGSEVDVLLVGDSLGMVMLGYDSTVPVTMDEMIHHCRAVRRGAPEKFVLGDMPFGSYHTGHRDAIINGHRFLKEADCDAVKLEGGRSMCGVVEALVEAGVPVMAHIGLTPQTASQLGGYKLQGKGMDEAAALLEDALALEKAGAFGLLMECVPDSLAAVITESLTIPTIGIGAGAGCDGQVLVIHDLLGMFEGFRPKFVQQFAHLAPLIRGGVDDYCTAVQNGNFPAKQHSFSGAGDYTALLKK